MLFHMVGREDSEGRRELGEGVGDRTSTWLAEESREHLPGSCTLALQRARKGPGRPLCWWWGWGWGWGGGTGKAPLDSGLGSG